MNATSLVALAASFLFACTMAPAPISESLPSGKPSTPSTPAAAAKDSATSTAAATAATPTDGTWDITAAGPDPIGASQMTIKGGQIDGVIVLGDEGTSSSTADGNGNPVTCTVLKHRITFSFTVKGDALSGTAPEVYTFDNNDACGGFTSGSNAVTATRTPNANNATGATAFEGDWTIKNDDGTPGTAVTVAGLVALAWDSLQAETAGASPLLRSTVQNGAANTATANVDLTFAARKR